MRKKTIIVGGVAGGASFAARLRRLDESMEIIMLEKGEFISFANCGLPYHIGGVIPERADLIVQTPAALNARYNIDIRTGAEVTAVNPSAKHVTINTNGAITIETYDHLFLAPGARPFVPPFKGSDHPRVMTLRTIPDTDRIKQMVDSGNVGRALVIGGGFIGLEMAENLRIKGINVTLVELSDQIFMPADREMAVPLLQHMRDHGIDLRLRDSVEEICETPDAKISVRLKSGASIPADLVIAAIGVTPDTAFLKSSGIALNARGAIIVDAHMRTSIPDVFAAGDAVEVTDFVTGAPVQVPLAGPANRQARIAADNIAGIPATYKKTQGTAVCKVFDLTAAVTGMNEKTARRLNIPYLKSYTHSANHAGYYPGSSMLAIKLLFSPENGRVLGGQVIGKEGVDKRIDILAVAVRHGLTVYDLSELELAYAPPYGSAKDAVNMAGFVAQNILERKTTVCYPEDIASIDTAGEILLDVRSKGEHRLGAIPGNILISLNELRARIGELDKTKPVTVYCQIGLRGYVAGRILAQAGFRVRNLSGGYTTYSQFTAP